MIVALLVAVPCWLVATALYSAVSLTIHLGERKKNKKTGVCFTDVSLCRISGNEKVRKLLEKS